MENNRQKVSLVIGASSGVGRSLSEQLAKLGHALILIARDQEELERNCTDLQLRYNVKVIHMAIDLANPQSYQGLCSEVISRAKKLLGSPPQAVFVTAGASFDKIDNMLISGEAIQQLININFIGIASILKDFASYFKKIGSGHLAVCSSIAAPVPRRNNIFYTAAKVALESICKSLQTEFFDTGVTLQVYRLGYVDTRLSYGQKLLFPVISPDDVALQLVQNMNRKSIRLQYIPGFWRYIILCLRILPWPVFARLKF